MDTEELDDLIEDGDDVMDYRARAKTELDRIARQTKNALAEHGIDLTVFFMVQSSGPLLTFGTMSDPPARSMGTGERDRFIGRARGDWFGRLVVSPNHVRKHRPRGR